jgi:hypothetical protein
MMKFLFKTMKIILFIVIKKIYHLSVINLLKAKLSPKKEEWE